jgi:cobalt-zinc-cadmium resistance protein CzcA
VNELISGIKSDVAIKIFGDDLDVLRATAEQVAPILSEIEGAEDVKIEQVSGLSQIEVRMDRQAMARHKINVADINLLVEVAFGGKVTTTVYEGQKRFAVLVRYPEDRRDSIRALERALVPSPAGYNVPLGELAEIKEVEAPAQISREDSRRRVLVECNVRGRDMGGFVKEAKARLSGIEGGLPHGYRFVWGGQFENQERAMARLMLVVPITLLLIFLMLYGALGSLRSALVILLNLPFALVGGVLAIYFLDINLSVAASIGFIALLGVAVENGLVLVSFFDQLRTGGSCGAVGSTTLSPPRGPAGGLGVREAVVEACRLRARPLLMTTMTTLLGLLPMLYATGSGSEIQKPLVAVIFGGLASSLVLTLIVLPVLYALVNGLPADGAFAAQQGRAEATETA